MSKKHLVFAALWFFLASCKDAATLQGITVTPADQNVALYSAAIQYTAIGRYSDQSTEDLTQTVIWSIDSSSDTLFSSNIKGLLTPSRPGSFILLATPSGTDSSSDTVGYTSLRVTP